MIVQVGHREKFDNPKYYDTYHSVVTIVEHVIDCFHTIVTDESNPYHQPISWLTRKQTRPTLEDLYSDLLNECSRPLPVGYNNIELNLSLNLRNKLEKLPTDVRDTILARKDDEGCTPFFEAVKNGHMKIANYLLDTCEPNIEQRCNYEVPEDNHVHLVAPIWIAAVKGHYKLVKLLLDYGANVNSLSDSGSTTLRSICYLCSDDELPEIYDNYFEIVKLLVDRGADINKANFNGATCLINSLRNYNLTAYLISKGANVNSVDNYSKSALHYAIEKGRVEVTRLLLDNGADPLILSIFGDDALQTSCIYGRKDIFDLLIGKFNYTNSRLHDAYKLLGSSIFDLNNDLILVRSLWTRAFETYSTHNNNETDRNEEENNTIIKSTAANMAVRNLEKTRRDIAYSNKIEFQTIDQVNSFTIDDFEIQSLIITERVLGTKHRETVQRIVTRGTNYMYSLRLQRCLDMWIYSLSLKLDQNSILSLDSMFATQTVTKLLIEMILQEKKVLFGDVYEILSLLIDEMEKSVKLLSYHPQSKSQSDLFDTLMKTILNLLIVLYYVTKRNSTVDNDQREQRQQQALVRPLYRKLAFINPKDSRGNNLLHGIVFLPSPGYDLSLDSSCKFRFYRDYSAILYIMEKVINVGGLNVDSTNPFTDLSALQCLCLSNHRVPNKRCLLKQLVDLGAHVDKRPSSAEMAIRMRESLTEAGLKPSDHVSLACLAARVLMQSNMQFDRRYLPPNLYHFIKIH